MNNNKASTESTPFITTPTQSWCLDPQTVGGKATQLAKLAQQGHPVPAFAVLTTHLFDRLLDALTLSNDLKALYTSDMTDSAREERRSEIADKILQSAHQSPIESEIIAALNLLPSNERTSGTNLRSKGGKGGSTDENGKTTGENESSTTTVNKQTFCLAVRSSSIDEDTARATHAGLFETVLGITSIQQLILAVHRVMASVVSAPVLAYQQERQHASTMRCGVILQTLIPADSAGVLFTASPKQVHVKPV